MNMKKVSVAMMVMLGLGMSSVQAAETGTLNFTGTVMSGTCSVNSNSRALAVSFDAISRATLIALGSSGTTSPELQRPISINLTGCPESVTTAKVNFEGAVSSYNANVFTTSGAGAASYTGVIIKGLC